MVDIHHNTPYTVSIMSNILRRSIPEADCQNTIDVGNCSSFALFMPYFKQSLVRTIACRLL